MTTGGSHVGENPVSCGHVGCRDSSANRHAANHFHETRHPIVRPFEPGEDWRWCYVDRVHVELRDVACPREVDPVLGLARTGGPVASDEREEG